MKEMMSGAKGAAHRIVDNAFKIPELAHTGAKGIINQIGRAENALMFWNKPPVTHNGIATNKMEGIMKNVLGELRGGLNANINNVINTNQPIGVAY